MSNCAAAFGPNLFVVGDPIDVVSGANLDGQTDFFLAGPLPLPFGRGIRNAGSGANTLVEIEVRKRLMALYSYEYSEWCKG